MELRVDAPNIIGFAHRGGRAHAPENTLEAFLIARRMGASAFETDVWITADGVPVIDHDGKIGHRGRRRPIARLDAADLPARVPTLEQLGEAIGPDADLSIDVKDPDAFEAILEVRARSGSTALAHTWLCDTDLRRLARWRSADPTIHLVASLRRRKLFGVELDHLVDLGIEVLNLPKRSWTPGLVTRCHRAGLGAFAWGVQRRWRMRLLVRWGIDGIHSDHVDRLVDVIGQEGDRRPTDGFRASRSD
ncbi:MAG: glycerophosphodiester phosphodiesterase [Actinobacteria bacterium]|nr:glycerophosphodiester phosphodiesterase [Actinomycetota bacterium]